MESKPFCDDVLEEYAVVLFGLKGKSMEWRGVPVAWLSLAKHKGLFRLGNESSATVLLSIQPWMDKGANFFFAIHMQSVARSCCCYCSSSLLQDWLGGGGQKRRVHYQINLLLAEWIRYFSLLREKRDVSILFAGSSGQNFIWQQPHLAVANEGSSSWVGGLLSWPPKRRLLLVYSIR